MKKITITLLALLCLSGLIKGQANIKIVAPIGNSISFINGPNGDVTNSSWKCVQLITASELSALTSNSIISAAFGYALGPLQATPGNINVYLENTNDVTFNKSNIWTTAISGMSVCYSGTMTVPPANDYTAVALPFSTPFNYTGGGLYIAWDWSSNGPFNPIFSGVLSTNLLGTNIYMSEMASTTSPTIPITTLNQSLDRFAVSFEAANTATNEIGITRVNAPYNVPKLATTGHLIEAEVRNAANIPATNITVSLSVAGANTFSDVKTINSLAPGTNTTITFSAFNASASGVNTISVKVSPDANLANNVFTLVQHVSCDVLANIPPLVPSDFSNGDWGSSTAGILASKMVVPGTASLTAIKTVFGTDIDVVGEDFYAVVLDASANIVATSNTITATLQMLSSSVSFEFYPAVPLTPNGTYYFGLAYPANTYPLAGWNGITQDFLGFIQPYEVVATKSYYVASIGGGNVGQLNIPYLGIEAILSYSNNAITALASKTLACKNDAPGSIILTASGASTYTWNTNATTSTVAVTPTVTGVSGGVSFTVNGFNATTNCKASKAVVTISVDMCTGIVKNEMDALINVYPNPALNGKCNITGLQGRNTISIFNSLGQLVVMQNTSEETAMTDLSEYPAGTYLVKITNDLNESKIIKLLNQNNQ